VQAFRRVEMKIGDSAFNIWTVARITPIRQNWPDVQGESNLIRNFGLCVDDFLWFVYTTTSYESGNRNNQGGPESNMSLAEYHA